jgi:predicted MFS family arabinose efflux permease
MAHKQTCSAFLWSKVLNMPFWVMFNLLPIILYKELGASPFHVTLLIVLKPTVALLAPYWSISVSNRKDRLLSNLVWANILKYLPFLFFPYFRNLWFFIAAFSIHAMFIRGIIPAWMEVLKLNINKSSRNKTFALGSALDYLAGAIFPLCLGWLLDDYTSYWKWIFTASAILGTVSTFFLFRIPMEVTTDIVTKDALKISWKHELLKPIKQIVSLLRKRRDFFNFQIGFMLGGAGIMIMQPALPLFFVDTLNLSYTKMLIAISACKGIGFLITTPLWVKHFGKVNIYFFSSHVTLFAVVFSLFIIMSSYNIVFLYVAFLMYGTMQAGSELSWNMSGPAFSHNEDSSIYSTANVFAIGLRGCVIPLIGSMVCSLTSPVYVMALSAALCAIATLYFKSCKRTEDFLVSETEH